MIRTIDALFGFLVLALAGCAALERPVLDAQVAATVKVSNDNPPPGCTYLGTVKGSSFAGNANEAQADVQHTALIRGGNWVAVDLLEPPRVLGLGSYGIYGRLFACPTPGANAAQPTVLAPPSSPPAPATPPAPAPPANSMATTCDPGCAPGYVCTAGACVAAPTPQAAVPGH